MRRHVRLADLDRGLGLERETLAVLNPERRRGTPPSEAYALQVPTVVTPSFDASLAALPPYVPLPQESYARHRVRRGEALSTIARRYRTAVNAIVRANDLCSRNRVQVRQRLKIPQRGSSKSSGAATEVAATTLNHKVRRGDRLWRLASHYGTTVDRTLHES